jgi:integrase
MQNTVNNWLDEWLEVYVKPCKKEKTYRCYDDAIKRIRRQGPEFPYKMVNEVHELEVQIFINSLASKYAKSTLNDMRVVINQSFLIATRNRYCDVNPIGKLSIPKEASQKNVRALTQSEQIKVEQAAKRDILGYIVLFFLYIGIRSSELCSLKWEDYNSDKESIRIIESKTKTGVRTIPLIPEANNIINSLPHYNDYIFNSTRKSPVTESVLKRLYQRMRRETGIDFLTNHVYRHSFATRLIENGVDYKALSVLLGHTDIAFTLRQYTTAEDNFLKQ